MKHILTTMCILVLVIYGSSSLAAEAASDVVFSPIYVETYNYGDFDELGMNKIYQLSPSDNPRLIPTEDFEHNGRRYFLTELIREDEVGTDSEDGCGTVTYTAVFGSEKLPGKAKASDYLSYTANRETHSDPLWQKSIPVVITGLLILLVCDIFESRRAAYHPDETDDEIEA